VTQKPGQAEVRVKFVLEDHLKIELDIRLPREPRVVSQQPELEAIAEEPPQVIRRTVEEVLQQPVWRGAKESASSNAEQGTAHKMGRTGVHHFARTFEEAIARLTS
jgi:hypothetical protein